MKTCDLKTYKIKFDTKKQKEYFVEGVEYDDSIGPGYTVGPVRIVDDSKKKSVVVRAENKKAIRKAFDDAERMSQKLHDYCLGVEDEDYQIKRVDDDEYDR